MIPTQRSPPRDPIRSRDWREWRWLWWRLTAIRVFSMRVGAVDLCLAWWLVVVVVVVVLERWW